MYTEFFGFSVKPFNVTPDPRFLYLSPSHQEALASMIYGIRERRGFVTIIGEVGTGKTTLLHTLFKELDKDTTTVFIFNTRINFNQLLQNILIELELTPKSNNKSELLHQLNDFLIEKLSLNENVALVIDEAQNLHPNVLEELRMLSNLETATDKLLQIILVGQPELDYKLRSPNLRQLKQRIGINCYLTPLNYDERIKYVLHRLTVAGCKDGNIFSQKAIKLICNHSGGIPRIINILCDNALLTAYGKECIIIDTDIVDEVISDYERSQFPGNKEDEHISPVQKEKKTIFTKMLLSIALFLFVLIILLILGVSVYKDKFNSFNQIASTLLTSLSISQQENDLPAENAVVKDNTKNLKESPQHTIRDRDIRDLNMNTSPKVTDDGEITNESLSSSEQIHPQLESNPMPVNSVPVGGKYKAVFAKRGDMISTLVLREYGILSDTICDIVKRANPEIEDLNQISVRQKIILPDLDIESRIVEVGDGVFAIHIVSFSSYDDAKEYFSKSMRNNHSISLSPVKIAGNKHWYRITMGNFSSRAQAIEFAKKNNLDTFL